MSSTIVALGDSFSCGEGVGLDIRPEQTWTALLCDALPGARLLNLSTAGARVRDVRRDQLPAAVAAAPELTTIMVGLNDVIRSGLSARQLEVDMRALVGELHGRGATVLISRWHDPGVVLGLPTGLRRALAQRLAWVNDAVDAATAGGTSKRGSGDPHVLTLDLARVPELLDPGAWAVDGVHPSPAGHRAIALSATRILVDSGLPGLRIPEVPDLLPMPPRPGRMGRVGWLLSRGLPWLVQHSGRVAPAVLSMATEAVRVQRQSPSARVLAIGQRRPGKQIGCLVTAGDGIATQPLPDRGVAGIGQGSSAPEVAWTAR